MIKRRFVLCVLLLVALLFACYQNSTSAEQGGAPSEYYRIISAAPSITEIIVALGFADRIIAADRHSHGISGLPESVLEVDFFQPDIEAVGNMRPDIIISGEINAAGSLESPFQFLARFGVSIVQIPSAASIADIHRDIITIARALGAEDRGQQLVADMIERTAAITAAYYPLLQTHTFYFEIAPPPSIVSFGQGTFLGEMVELLGGYNIFNAQNRWFVPNAETIIRSNPDVIFTLVYNDIPAELIIAEVKSRPGFGAINAVLNNRVYAINGNNASRPSHNIVLALEEIAAALYPAHATE